MANTKWQYIFLQEKYDYFGARYYDPKYQYWTTSDPALSDYFSDTQKGEGGVFNHINLNTYHYACNNPIAYTDPDGKFANWIIGAIVGFATSTAKEIGSRMCGEEKMSLWGCG